MMASVPITPPNLVVEKALMNDGVVRTTFADGRVWFTRGIGGWMLNQNDLSENAWYKIVDDYIEREVWNYVQATGSDEAKEALRVSTVMTREEALQGVGEILDLGLPAAVRPASFNKERGTDFYRVVVVPQSALDQTPLPTPYHDLRSRKDVQNYVSGVKAQRTPLPFKVELVEFLTTGTENRVFFRGKDEAGVHLSRGDNGLTTLGGFSNYRQTAFTLEELRKRRGLLRGGDGKTYRAVLSLSSQELFNYGR